MCGARVVSRIVTVKYRIGSILALRTPQQRVHGEGTARVMNGRQGSNVQRNSRRAGHAVLVLALGTVRHARQCMPLPLSTAWHATCAGNISLLVAQQLPHVSRETGHTRAHL